MNTSKFKPQHFINRELSWLEFNQRVLDEALDRTNPLLERLKFFAIVSSNLDEFFQVRVAGLKQQIEGGGGGRSEDGLTARETFQAIIPRVRRMVQDQYACWRADLQPALARSGLRLLNMADLDTTDRAWVEEFYRTQVRPVLTPLAIDPAHPFPQLLNKSLNLIVRLEMAEQARAERAKLLLHTAVVQIPRGLSRLVQLPRSDARQDYIFLGQLIGHFLADLFPGTTVLGWWRFRVTRNSELYVDEEGLGNLVDEDLVYLLDAVEVQLHKRRRGDAVRLEIDPQCPEIVRTPLLRTLGLTEDDLYLVHGPLNPARLLMLSQGDHFPELRDPPFVAPESKALRGQKNIFAAIRRGDVLLHHPYENFLSVVDFLQQAAADPGVLAIKMTLYRTGGDKDIVDALMDAVNQGKQVTAVVELRARFDEANNIDWARRLEENGVHVVYGLVGYKIHAKVALVVRREGNDIRRYVHLATGNYNPTTARLYTDIGLLTCRPEFGEDATNLFNLLTGVCQFQGMKKLIVAPFDLHPRMLQLIERETANARDGLPARIIAKMNSLVEPEIIRALYRASQAGVKIDLIVRGICCLRPGVKGISDNIAVRSIVDRFLEHSRIFYFENARQPEVFLGSADWMPRNFFRRIEAVFPIEDGNLRERIIREILATSLGDTAKARVLQSDGSYQRIAPAKGEPRRRSQADFVALTNPEDRRPGASTKGGPRHLRVELAPSPFAPRKK